MTNSLILIFQLNNRNNSFLRLLDKCKIIYFRKLFFDFIELKFLLVLFINVIY